MNLFILIAACSLSCPSYDPIPAPGGFITTPVSASVGAYSGDGRALNGEALKCNPTVSFTLSEDKAKKALAEGDRVFDIRVHVLSFDVVELSRIPEPQKFTTKETAVEVGL